MSHDPSRNGGDQGQEARPRGPGQRLREQREALGLPLAQAAQDLRILRSVLQALEEDRYDALEAPIFVRGHLKNYARLLDLPPEEIVEAYERSLPVQETPELRIDTEQGPVMNEGTPGWVISVAWLLVLTMLVLGGLWWYAGPHREPLGAVNVGEEQDAPDAAESEASDLDPDHSPVDDGDPAGLELFQPLDIEPDRERRLEASAEQTDPEQMDPGQTDREADEAAPADGEAQAEPQIDGQVSLIDDVDPAERREITLSLDEDSWLEVHDGDNRQLYYGLAAEGEQLSLVGRAPISLFMGNAPAVNVSVDGEALDFSARIRRDNTARITIAPVND